ncbi:alpha/beta hydrolase [Streptomyces sp. JH002]|uniref:alpha/beta hydrolase fold domain-containing protein n=1 Tax=Streptomyces sp. JH002 TaxID=2763259 RepID=UPI003D802EBF
MCHSTPSSPRSDGLRRYDPADPEAGRQFEAFFRDPAPWPEPEADTEEHTVSGPHGPIPVRVYRPRGRRPGRALLWLHGGGFRAGDLDMPEAHLVSAELAARAGALVVSVGYRLAVDGVRYPVPVDDVRAAWRWLTGPEAPTYTGRPSLGGASAGAALALSAAIGLRDDGSAPPAALLLAYPFAHFPVPVLDDDTAALMRELPPILRFGTESIEDMVRNYVGRITELPPAAMPGAARLTGLPPTGIVLSELDDLRPSGELLARQLTESGVPTRTCLAAGMLHGHLNRTPSLDEVDRSLTFFATLLAG